MIKTSYFLEEKSSLFFNHSNCSHYILWSNVSVFAIERMVVIHYLKCTVPFSFAVSLAVTRWSLMVICCHSLLFVVTRFHSLYLLLQFIVTLCHSLPFAVTLVVTRCTTRLFFYKRSKQFSLSSFFLFLY